MITGVSSVTAVSPVPIVIGWIKAVVIGLPIIWAN